VIVGAVAAAVVGYAPRVTGSAAGVMIGLDLL